MDETQRGQWGEAGIGARTITGDHAGRAQGIARKTGRIHRDKVPRAHDLGAQGIDLVFGPTEDDAIGRALRRRNESLLGGLLVRRLVFVSTVFMAGVYAICAYDGEDKT